jgi:hypothetical protein
MAYKKRTFDVTTVIPAAEPVAMVRVTNMKMSRREIPLIDGSSIHLGAWHNKSTVHISEPIEKNSLPPAVFKMASRGEICIEEV